MSESQKPFLSYGKQWIDDEDIAAVLRTLKSDYLTQGPEVEHLEEEIKKITGARYCVAVSNATAALHIAVSALEIMPGLEGITSPITFVASANCLPYNKLIPIFADIDDKTYCIDPSEIEKKIGPKTRVLVPVDFAGQPADMAAIKKIADKFELKVVEDAAHAIGSYYPNGSPVGSCAFSDMTIFSFHPVKTITTGEGGIITTNDEELFNKLLLLRSHGIVRNPSQMSKNPGPWYHEMVSLGYNYRMTDIQAALGTSQLRKLEFFKRRRKEIISQYNKAFSSLPHVRIPYEAPMADSCFHLYVVRLDFNAIKKNRAEVMSELLNNGVGTQVHYIPVPLQPFYRREYGYNEGDFPISERYYQEALSLPLYPRMSDNDVCRVISALATIVS
ncbi:MAG: UDP-4-amino-4,6-dideoxy-N-acetyl-beta-L-altrosamine transaminase [Candidatus Zixiibacteriota bacterium]